jgi:hypothetical protein
VITAYEDGTSEDATILAGIDRTTFHETFAADLRFFPKFRVQVVAQHIPNQVEGQDCRGNC